jgi:hypothetical protein
MKMRQPLSAFEAAFREEAAESVAKREHLRREAAQRSRMRRKQRVQKVGKVRFVMLALAILATAVGVTIAMFEALALIAG